MTISSNIWDWVASLLGLQIGESLFLPAYWRLVATLTAPLGWAPAPEAVMTVLLLLSMVGVAGFWAKRRSGWLHLPFAVWGALLADTPYVSLAPVLVWLAWLVAWRAARVLRKEMPDPMDLPWARLGTVGALAFLVVAAGNYATFGFSYVTGYARHTAAALSWDGGWHPLEARRMDALLCEYVAEIAREAENRRFVFTDGLCDAGIELASRGVRAVALSGGAYDSDYWRRVGFVRQEDLAALEGGACGLLRSWAVDRPDELTNAAYQCGFAFLEKEAAGRLETDGLVLRGKRAVGGERASGLAAQAVCALAGRIVAYYENGGCPANGGRMRSARFCSMQWRVARALRRRASELDRRRLTEEALALAELSEKLDRLNPYARRRGAAMESADLRAFGSLTPREGLAFSLKRANFTLARQFALPILKDDPANADANFALAMGHFQHREFALARHYFREALKARPDDAALHNNIAVASLELGEMDDAEASAQAALKLKPDSASVRDTVRQVERKKRILLGIEKDDEAAN